MATKNELQEIGEKVVTKRRGGNNKQGIGLANVNAYLFEDDDERKAFTRKALSEALEYWDMPKVQSSDEARERTKAYFQRCIDRAIKPTVEEYALALGTTRAMLWDWETGRKHGPMDGEIIKRAKEYIASYDAKAVIEGKLNPVTYIFRGKNYYGMKDQQDVVVTPNTLESRPRAELIAEASMLPEDGEA